jgi:hypothetical protein
MRVQIRLHTHSLAFVSGLGLATASTVPPGRPTSGCLKARAFRGFTHRKLSQKRQRLAKEQGTLVLTLSFVELPQAAADIVQHPLVDGLRWVLHRPIAVPAPLQANCRTHRPQKLKRLISLCTNPVSILSVPIQAVR